MKKIKQAVSAFVICSMLNPAGAFADADLSYVSDGIEVSVPYAGQLSTKADAAGGVLVTAVYDKATGNLEKVDLSDELETAVDIESLKGKTVKNFILDSMGSLKPLEALSERSLSLRADADENFARTILTWSRMRDFECEYYRVEKNGEIIAEVDGGVYSYADSNAPSADNVYAVKAYNSKNELVSLSNEAVSGDGKNAFDPSLDVVEVMSPESMNTVTYAGSDRQVAIVGSSSNLDASTNVGINADYGWTFAEIGGRKAVYTNWYYNNATESAVAKRGNIYVNLGSNFDEDGRVTTLTFDYYDTGSGGISVRYVNGIDESGSATHNVIKVNFTSEGWKTATLDISDCYFNKAADSRLQRYADLRFEPAGTAEVGMSPVYIGRMEFDNTFGGYGEYTASSDNEVSATGNTGSVRNSGSYISLMGDESLSAVEANDGSVSYTSSTVTDTAYMFVEEIDGRSAVMSTVFTNKSGVSKTGNLAFALNDNAFVPEDKIYTVKIDFNSNYAAPAINYVSGVTETTAEDGTVTYKFTYSTKSAAQITGDGVWKTAVFNIDNALFNYNGGGKYSAFYNGTPVFRVVCSKTVYISSVSIALPWSATSGCRYDEAEVSFNADGQVSDGVAVYDVQNGTQVTSDNVMIYTQAGPDNSWAVSSNSYRDGNSSRKTYVYFTVDDNFIAGGRDSYAEIEFTYLDVSDASMTLHYFDNNGRVKSAGRRQSATGEWKTAKFVLKDANFANNMNKMTDFRLSLDTTSADNQMIIKNLKVRNIGCATQEHITVPKIYLAGDSTCEPFYTTASGKPREGWGMELGGIFNDEIDIINKAKGGKSTRSYLNDRDISSGINNPDNRWAEILRNGKSGDYLFIQLGHNDRAEDERSTDPESLELNEESYRYNLKRFVVAAREKGMIPVFLTSLWVRHQFNEDGTLGDTTIEPYREAMREIGEKYSVPVLDVGAVHKELVERLGEEGSKQIFCYASEEEYPDFAFTREDNTHINKTGAIEVCKIIANEIKRLSADYPEIKRLSGYLEPTADLEYIG